MLTDALGHSNPLPGNYVQMRTVDAEVRGLSLPTSVQV